MQGFFLPPISIFCTTLDHRVSHWGAQVSRGLDEQEHYTMKMDSWGGKIDGMREQAN